MGADHPDRRRQRGLRAPIPEKWIPVSRLREALGSACPGGSMRRRAKAGPKRICADENFPDYHTPRPEPTARSASGLTPAENGRPSASVMPTTE